MQAAKDRTMELWEVTAPGCMRNVTVQTVSTAADHCGLLTAWKLCERARSVQAAKDRTMELWKVTAPGCMRDFTALPVSTTAEHYQRKAAHEAAVDKRNFLQRNAYTEHSEQAASTMKSLISDKK